MSVLDDLDREEQQASGGGGTIAKCKLELGFKVFVTGLDNRGSFFAYRPGDEASKKEALLKAKAVLNQHVVKGNPQVAFQIVVYRETVKGRVVNWKDDRFFVTPLWTPGYKEVVKPHLKEAGIDQLGEFWMKVSFAPDPSGRKRIDTTDLDDDGQPKVKDELVAFVAKVYKSEAEAEAEAGETEPAGGSDSPSESRGAVNPDVPKGWLPKAWAGIVPELRKAAAAGQSPATIATDYGVEVRYVAAALSDATNGQQ